MSTFKKERVIGRDPDCDIVIANDFVSRKHAVIKNESGRVMIKDLGSTNGTFINGKRISPNDFQNLNRNDIVNLSNHYKLNLLTLIEDDSDATQILPKNFSDSNILYKPDHAVFRDGQRTVVFDPNRTELGELSSNDKRAFVTIGRQSDNTHVIDDPEVSRKHCRIRLLTPNIVEVEDLGSTNGTFADNVRLPNHQVKQFNSAVRIRLGKSRNLDLKTIFPLIQIIERKPPTPERSDAKTASPARPTTPHTTVDEMRKFNDLEEVWNEYTQRQNQASNAAVSFPISGAVLGLAAAALTGATGGIGGLLLLSGGGVLGRWLGQQKSNEIRQDITWENAFLETYCCPRCKESFQKKPWITIRECFKCKVKFR